MAKRREVDLARLNGNRILLPALITGRPGEEIADKLDIPGIAGAINAYVCRDKNCLTIVQHVDKGLTPNYMACQAPGCIGTARSMNYPPDPPQKVIDAVRWEWYRPDLEEFRQLNPEIKQFVMGGGLILREKVNNVDS